MIYDIYTASYCSFCVEAVGILVSQGCSFHAHDVTNDQETRQALTERSGCKTLPQIWLGSEFIGGCSDLKEYFSNKNNDKT